MKFDNNTPIYIQIVEKLKLEIISGNLCCGQRIPSVRDLALKLQVNPNTIQKALEILEDLKLIYTQRTNGKFVTDDNKVISKYKKEYSNKIIDDFYQGMTSLKISKKEAIELLNERIK